MYIWSDTYMYIWSDTYMYIWSDTNRLCNLYQNTAEKLVKTSELIHIWI